MKYTITLTTALLLLVSCGKTKQVENNVQNEEPTMTTNTSSSRPMKPATRYFSDFDKNNTSMLEIDFNGAITYRGVTSTGGYDVNEKLPEMTTSEMGQGIKYVVNTKDDKILTVHIFEEGCDNNEKKRKTFIELKTAEGRVILTYKGCGIYHNGTGLHGLWVIEEVNGLAAAEFLNSKKLTLLELNLQGNTFYGSFACRKIIGGYDIAEQKLFISIRQAPNFECTETSEESNLVQLFGEKEFHYQVKNNRLVLTDSETTLIFRKTD